jgi:hypothetical protein
MARSRLLVGVALMLFVLVACSDASSSSGRSIVTTTAAPLATTPAATTTTSAATTTPASTTTVASTTTPGSTTTTIELNFDTTEAVKLLDNITWWTSNFAEYPLDELVTLKSASDRFASAEAQQRAITDGFIAGLKRASAPATPPAGMFRQATLYFDAFGGAPQASDAVNSIFLKTDALGPLTATVKIESLGQTVYVWKPSSNPGLDLIYSGVLLGPDLLSIYAQGMNMTDAEIQQAAARIIAADVAASAQAGKQ